MKKVLAGIDGSPESDAAAKKAAELAVATGASLTLVYVVPHHPPPGPSAYMKGMNLSDLVERDYVPALLRQAETDCGRPGLQIDTASAIGSPANALAEMAEAGRFDLVVVGHRGRGAVQRTLLGSVADRLTQISSCPVLIVR